MDWLKSLDLSLWWRALFAGGIALTIAAVAVKDRDIVIIGFGICAFGLGEWLNWPKHGLIEHGLYKTWYERVPCISGSILNVVGLLLIAWGGYRLLFW